MAEGMPALRVRNKGLVRARVCDVLENPENYRLHPEAQRGAFGKVEAEIGYFGYPDVFEHPDFPGRYMLVDGELRKQYLERHYGPETEIEWNLTDFDLAEARTALATKDPIAAMAKNAKDKYSELVHRLPNRTSELQSVLESMAQAARVEVPSIGAARPNVDAVPAPPDAATTQRGDIWLLGDHRLMCGDSASPADLDRLLDGAVIHLVNTDPPYNVKVEPRSNNAIAAGLSSFQAPTSLKNQQLDVSRHPDKSKATHKQMRAKDRPLANDFVTDAAFDELLAGWFGNIARVLVPGGGFYIWGGYANCSNYPPALKAAELYFSQAIIWIKEHPVLTRKDFMGNHEWCQPPDTVVLTPSGSSRLGDLADGDRVVGYGRNWNRLIGLREGIRADVGTRHYDGDMFEVTAGKKSTWCTDGHIWSVRLNDRAQDLWCVYLMRRGPWWRVGKVRLLGEWGFGLKYRMREEKAEAGWILSVHTSNAEAMCAEQVASVRYGIPTTFWEDKRGLSQRSAAHIRGIYEQLDLLAMHAKAKQALVDHGRRFEYPFALAHRSQEKFGRRVPLTMRASNLIPGVMDIPSWDGAGQECRWAPIRSVDRQRYTGKVQSLGVPKHQHYVADGLVTHNCFYGWREGGPHRWFGPKNIPDTWEVQKTGWITRGLDLGLGVKLVGPDGTGVVVLPLDERELPVRALNEDDAVVVRATAVATDVWRVKKVTPQAMVHLTEKPVELAERAMRYSSQLGENVLDLFGGSGSTLMAAEVTGRRAFLMELDELYCDVIVARWEAYTGRKAVRLRAAVGVPVGDPAATRPATSAEGDAARERVTAPQAPDIAQSSQRRGTKGRRPAAESAPATEPTATKERVTGHGSDQVAKPLRGNSEAGKRRAPRAGGRYAAAAAAGDQGENTAQELAGASLTRSGENPGPEADPAPAAASKPTRRTRTRPPKHARS